jgi:hypothetical protein
MEETLESQGFLHTGRVGPVWVSGWSDMDANKTCRIVQWRAPVMFRERTADVRPMYPAKIPDFCVESKVHNSSKNRRL